MGKTVPSYRMALEFEIQSWKGFRKALVDEETREASDMLMDMCRSNAMAGSAAADPVLFQPMVMSILLSQAKRISALEERLNVVLARRAGLIVDERHYKQLPIR